MFLFSTDLSITRHSTVRMLTIAANEKGIIDASRKNLVRCDQIRPAASANGVWPVSLVVDYNNLTNLNGLDAFEDATHFSAAHNQIEDIGGVSRLSKLSILNLSHNRLTGFNGIRSISNTLTWLSVSNNLIETHGHISYCTSLVHLDLSFNCIEVLSDISCLKSLQRLLLHNNQISNLKNAPKCLPMSITTLSLDDNSLTDLNNIRFLSPFTNLENLSIMNNECVQSSNTYPFFMFI